MASLLVIFLLIGLILFLHQNIEDTDHGWLPSYQYIMTTNTWVKIHIENTLEAKNTNNPVTQAPR